MNRKYDANHSRETNDARTSDARKRLSLHSETIRPLSRTELNAIRGGITTDSVTCPTRSNDGNVRTECTKDR